MKGHKSRDVFSVSGYAVMARRETLRVAGPRGRPPIRLCRGRPAMRARHEVE